MVKVDIGEIDYMMLVKNLFDVRWWLTNYAIHLYSIGWVSYLTCYIGQVVVYGQVDISHQFRLK
jgi:hypothetical protein